MLLGLGAVLGLILTGTFSRPGRTTTQTVAHHGVEKGVNFECADPASYMGGTDTYPQHPAAIATVVNDTKRAGVTWVRVFAFWYAIQPKDPNIDPTSQDFSLLDPCVKAINAAGLNVLLVPFRSPAWTQPDYGTGISYNKPPEDCAPPNTACTTFANFVKALASRYVLDRNLDGSPAQYADGTKLDFKLSPSNIAFELWNEPNDRKSFEAVCDTRGTIPRTQVKSLPGGTCSDKTTEKYRAGTEYANLFKAAQASVKSVSSSLLILNGGLAVHSYYPGARWLRDAYSTTEDLTGLMDVVALHSYPPYSATDRCPTVKKTFKPVRASMSVIKREDPGRPVWLTEIAWSATPGYCTTSAQEQRLSEALASSSASADTGGPANLQNVFWWLTDRKYFADKNCPTWICGTALLDKRTLQPLSIYRTFASAR